MRRWLPQFTIRRLMVGIGLLALLLAGVVEVRRLKHQARQYRDRASWHDAQAWLAGAWLVGMGDPARVVATTKRVIELRNREVGAPEPGGQDTDGKHLAAMTAPILRLRQAVVAEKEYHERQRERYERATARPWLVVPPDTAHVMMNLPRMRQDTEREVEAANTEFNRAMEAREASRPAP